jgi:hypothetical protein
MIMGGKGKLEVAHGICHKRLRKISMNIVSCYIKRNNIIACTEY